jgi:hypothetical protein
MKAFFTRTKSWLVEERLFFVVGCVCLLAAILTAALLEIPQKSRWLDIRTEDKIVSIAPPTDYVRIARKPPTYAATFWYSVEYPFNINGYYDTRCDPTFSWTDQGLGPKQECVLTEYSDHRVVGNVIRVHWALGRLFGNVIFNVMLVGLFMGFGIFAFFRPVWLPLRRWINEG